MTGGNRIRGRGLGSAGQPPAPPPDTTPPSAPTNLAAAPLSSTSISLTWTASTDNVAVTGYRVYRNGVLVGSPTATSYIDTGLTAATTYTYTVKAIDANSNLSSVSNSAVGTTSSSTVPTYTGPTPDVATKAQWDALYTSTYGSAGRPVAQYGYNGAVNFHWAESYMLRAYLNMARMYGIASPDYLARCVTMINAWQNYTATLSGYRGWMFSVSPNSNIEQGFLDTGGILAAMMEFCYTVLRDPARFGAYTQQAITYLSRHASNTSNTTYANILQFNGVSGAENLMGTIQNAYLSAVNGIGFYKQSTYGWHSVKPNNQGMLMGIASLFAYKAQVAAGITVTPQLLTNGANCCEYMRAQINATSGMGQWGANRPSAGLCSFPYGCTQGEAHTEDSSHAIIELRTMNQGIHFGHGGYSATNRAHLAGTLGNITASGQYITNYVDGTGGPIASAQDSQHGSVLACDWPDLANYGDFNARMTKVVQGYNYYEGNNPDWRFLGWSCIQRNLRGVAFY